MALAGSWEKRSLAKGNPSSPVVKLVLVLFQKQVSFERCKYMEIIRWVVSTGFRSTGEICFQMRYTSALG